MQSSQITKKLKLKPNRYQDHLHGKEGQILLSAFQCIVDKGIAATSTRAIASNADLNQGIIHYYFKSKDELLEKVIELLFKNAISNVEALGKSDLSPVEKIEVFLNFGHSLIVPRRDEWVAIIAFWGHAMTVGGKMLKHIQNQFQKLQFTLIKILEEGEGTGDFSPRSDNENKDIAIFIIGAVQGLATQYAIEPKQFDPRRPINLLKKIVIKMLKENS
jgi:AcrR family transcriptional regulator